MKTPIRLAIADDQKLFLKGMRFIVDSFENIDLIIEAENGQVLIDKVSRDLPDVILMDLKMPVMDGIEATKYLKKKYPDLNIILLTMHDDERLMTHMIELGANGYLLKDEEPEIVRQAIEDVVQKGFFFSDYLSKALLNKVKKKNKKNFTSLQMLVRNSLTSRELEVLQLICKEFTTAEIAEKLFISNRTVEGHRRNLQEKTNTRNVAGLVIYAIKNELVDIS